MNSSNDISDKVDRRKLLNAFSRLLSPLLNVIDFTRTKLGIKEKIVAMCDVLGFARLITEEELYRTATRYEILLNAVKSVSKTHIKYRGKKFTKRIEHVIFSDTILVWSDIDDLYLFYSFIKDIIPISLASGLPLRVGIAAGKCYIKPSKNIYVGKPIVDAYLLEESQEWIGCAFHSSCHDLPDFHGKFQYDQPPWVVEYQAPVKTGSSFQPRYSLDWMREQRTHLNNASFKQRYLIEILENQENERIKKKYENTVDFVDHCKRMMENYQSSDKRNEI
ncbi:MAG: hypothetical protein ACFFCS_02105 [Candidatus Hodarchaeota archaeon]